MAKPLFRTELRTLKELLFGTINLAAVSDASSWGSWKKTYQAAFLVAKFGKTDLLTTWENAKAIALGELAPETFGPNTLQYPTDQWDETLANFYNVAHRQTGDETAGKISLSNNDRTHVSNQWDCIQETLPPLMEDYIPSHISAEGKLTQAGNELLARRTISADIFKSFVTANPGWASQLEIETEVQGDCDLNLSPITHLSPLLYFAGKSTLTNCEQLKILEGNFGGHVNANQSGITHGRNLHITKSNFAGIAITLTNTGRLHTLEGNFAGCVSIANSSIRSLKNCVVTAGAAHPGLPPSPTEIPHGTKFFVANCPHLQPSPNLMGKDTCKDEEITKRFQRILAARKIQKNEEVEI